MRRACGLAVARACADARQDLDAEVAAGDRTVDDIVRVWAETSPAGSGTGRRTGLI